MRDHLLSAWEQSGKKPLELFTPPLPTNIAYLWEYFIQLHNRRINYGFGQSPLSYLEIDAWSRLTKTKLDQWELKAIIEIDNAFIASIAKEKADKPNG